MHLPTYPQGTSQHEYQPSQSPASTSCVRQSVAGAYSGTQCSSVSLKDGVGVGNAAGIDEFSVHVRIRRFLDFRNLYRIG